MVDRLTRTSGVREVKILPRSVRFLHDDGLDLRPVSFPDEPSVWSARLGQVEMLTYRAPRLLECIVGGWQEFRRQERFATHVCAWSRDGFYAELFPHEAWTAVPRYFDDVFGLGVVEVSAGAGSLPRGVVVMCGGRRLHGAVDDADFGLLLRRTREDS